MGLLFFSAQGARQFLRSIAKGVQERASSSGAASSSGVRGSTDGAIETRTLVGVSGKVQPFGFVSGVRLVGVHGGRRLNSEILFFVA